MPTFAPLNPNLPEIQAILAAALAEDIGSGDVTSRALVPEGQAARGIFLAKASGVVAGLPLLHPLFLHLDRDAFVKALVPDGTPVRRGRKLAIVFGSARALLAGERTALNLLQHLSGIATLARRYAEAARGTRCRILDTRKTLPGLRLLAKYAVRAGGGDNHRTGLFDQALIKDNHIALSRGSGLGARGPRKKDAAFFRELVAQARRQAPPGSPVEVEAATIAEALAASDAGADIVMLDNFTVPGIRAAVKSIRARHPRGTPPLLEASGGMTLEKAAAAARTGVDRISVGAITHSAPALDISMDIESIK